MPLIVDRWLLTEISLEEAPAFSIDVQNMGLSDLSLWPLLQGCVSSAYESVGSLGTSVMLTGRCLCSWVWIKSTQTLHVHPHSGELQMPKLRSHLMRTQSLKVLSWKPGVGQYTVIHATLAVRDFFLANFYPSGPFTCIFSKTSPELFLCKLRLTPVPVWAYRIKQVTLIIVTIDAGF